jgi:ABC-2 type transport system ATP-binding protein
MLLGLVYPTSGEITVLGEPMPRRAAQVLPQVGSLIEGPAAYPYLSGRRNLALVDAAASRDGRRARRARIEDVLRQVGLSGVDDRPVKTYSLGMRQRLGIAGALLRNPKLLILDEPTNGLDPQGIREIRDLLTALNEAGTTVFLSSHLLSEVEHLCTRVGIVDRGRLVLEDELMTLRAPTGRVLVQSPDAEAIAGMLNGRLVERVGERVVVRHADPAVLNAWLVGEGMRVSAIRAERLSLEQVVLAATGPGADRVDS